MTAVFRYRPTLLIVLLAMIFAFGSAVAAQAPITRETPRDSTEDERTNDKPSTLTETLSRLKVERATKEFEQMLARGRTAMKLAAEIERSYEKTGTLTREELSKLNEVEKLVKRVRKDLGADDDIKDDDSPVDLAKMAAGEVVKILSLTTEKLYQELKKTTRFSISAAAINTSNAALRVARFLKIAR